MKALILAAGGGKRLTEHCNGYPKCMLRMLGKPLVQHSLENAVQAQVSEIVLVVGYRAEEIVNSFGNRFQDVPIRYVFQQDPQGLVHAIECARAAVGDSDFMLFLADEILKHPRHREMIETFHAEDTFAICGVVDEPDIREIRKTYAVIQDETSHQIYRLVEKPRKPPNHTRGTGNCIFRSDIFDLLEWTPINPLRGEKELPDLIQCAIDDGHLIKSFDIGSGYININTPDDIQKAEQAYGTTLEWSAQPIEG